MDGVLIDSEPANLAQLQLFYQSYGVTASEAFLHHLVGSSVTYTAQQSIALLQQNWSVEEFIKLFDAFALQHPVSYRTILNKGVKETLHWLKANGYACAIGSSSPMENIQRMLRECELEGLFEVVLSGEMFQESKPNPQIYLQAANRLACDPKACMVIEDSSFGIEAGKKAGMWTIAKLDTRFGVDQSLADGKIQEIPDILKLLSKSL